MQRLLMFVIVCLVNWLLLNTMGSMLYIPLIVMLVNPIAMAMIDEFYFQNTYSYKTEHGFYVKVVFKSKEEKMAFMLSQLGRMDGTENRE